MTSICSLNILSFSTLFFSPLLQNFPASPLSAATFLIFCHLSSVCLASGIPPSGGKGNESDLALWHSLSLGNEGLWSDTPIVQHVASHSLSLSASPWKGWTIIIVVISIVRRHGHQSQPTRQARRRDLQHNSRTLGCPHWQVITPGQNGFSLSLLCSPSEGERWDVE